MEISVTYRHEYNGPFPDHSRHQQLPDAEGWFGSASAWLAGLPAGAVFFLLFAGTILMGALDTTLSFVVFLVMLGLLWAAGTTLANTFANGFRWGFLWLLLGFILFFNVGRLMDKADYWAFTFHMLLVIGILIIVCFNRYKMTVGRAILVTIAGTFGYILIGLPVSTWKWYNYNDAQFELRLDRQAAWLANLKYKLKDQREAEKRGAELRAKGEQAQVLPQTEHDPLPLYLKPFTPTEISVIEAMDISNRANLRTEVAIPAEIKERWLSYVNDEDNNMRLETPNERKDLIISWVSAWPGVLVYLLFDDVIERLVDWIYTKMEYYLGYIQRQIVGNRTEFLKQGQ